VDNDSTKTKIPWLLVRKRTIPTESPPLVGEVSVKLLRIEGVTWSAQRIPTAVNLGFLDLNNSTTELKHLSDGSHLSLRRFYCRIL
jgi:hypothetical protein